MKTKKWRLAGFVLLPILLFCGIGAFFLSRSGHLSVNLPIAHKGRFTSPVSASFPSRLHASGNHILDENGNTIRLKGVMPPDLANLAKRGRFNREIIKAIQTTGANVIRIPVHAENWINDGDYLWRYLDPVVGWAGEMGMYVIIDWHSIGNVVTGAGEQMPDTRQNSLDLALAFWSANARYFRDAPNVIFEVFNEPESISAGEWKIGAEKLIGAIRAEQADQLVIVGGIDYGKDLSWVMDSPVSDANLAYAAHIYPSHPAGGWDRLFGKVAEQYPVISTEWGFMKGSPAADSAYLVGTREKYGESFLGYLDQRGIGWVACWYDDEWLPPMYESGQGQLTDYGQFVLEELAESK